MFCFLCSAFYLLFTLYLCTGFHIQYTVNCSLRSSPSSLFSPRGFSLPLVSILDQIYITNLASILSTPIKVFIRGAALIRTHAYRRDIIGVIEAKPVSKTAQTRSVRDRSISLSYKNSICDATTNPSGQKSNNSSSTLRKLPPKTLSID